MRMAFSVASAPPLVKNTLFEVAGRQLGDQPGRLAAGVVGVDRGDRAQLVGLLLDRRHELGVLVADVDVDELAGEVEPAFDRSRPRTASRARRRRRRGRAAPAPTTSGTRGRGRRGRRWRPPRRRTRRGQNPSRWSPGKAIRAAGWHRVPLALAQSAASARRRSDGLRFAAMRNTLIASSVAAVALVGLAGGAAFAAESSGSAGDAADDRRPRDGHLRRHGTDPRAGRVSGGQRRIGRHERPHGADGPDDRVRHLDGPAAADRSGRRADDRGVRRRRDVGRAAPPGTLDSATVAAVFEIMGLDEATVDCLVEGAATAAPRPTTSPPSSVFIGCGVGPLMMLDAIVALHEQTGATAAETTTTVAGGAGDDGRGGRATRWSTCSSSSSPPRESTSTRRRASASSTTSPTSIPTTWRSVIGVLETCGIDIADLLPERLTGRRSPDVGDLGSTPSCSTPGECSCSPTRRCSRPLLAPYGGSTDLDRHRRAHYAAMAVKSHHNHGEHDWSAYDDAYVRSVGVDDDVAAEAADAARASGGLPSCGAGRSPSPSVGSVCSPTSACRSASCPTPAGRSPATLSGAGICQIGDGEGSACAASSTATSSASPSPIRRSSTMPPSSSAGIDRSRIVYVGDSVTIDVAAATAAGLRPCSSTPTTTTSAPPFERIGEVADLLIDSRETFVQNKSHTTVTKRWVPAAMKKLLALSAVGVLAFAACGDDDDDDGGDTTVSRGRHRCQRSGRRGRRRRGRRDRRGRRRRPTESAKPSTPPPARPRAEPLTRSRPPPAPGSGRAAAVARPTRRPAWPNAADVQAISRRAITLRHSVSSAPSKIDSTRASRNRRLTANSSA